MTRPLVRRGLGLGCVEICFGRGVSSSVYSQRIYDIPPEQVIGSALAVKYTYAKDGKPLLIKEPKLMLNDDNAGKPEGISSRSLRGLVH